MGELAAWNFGEQHCNERTALRSGDLCYNYLQMRLPLVRSIIVSSALVASNSAAVASNRMAAISSSAMSVPRVPVSTTKFINASTAQKVDEALMNSPGFAIEQLMELAGKVFFAS